MFNIKNALSFVATTLVESVSLTAELGVAVVVTCKDVATAGAKEGVAAAKADYVVATETIIDTEREAAVNKVMGDLKAAREEVVRAGAEWNQARAEGADEAAVEAAYTEAEQAVEVLRAAEQAILAVPASPKPLGFIARTKAVLHAVWVGVRTGVCVSYEDAPFIWAEQHSMHMERHHARVDARKAAHTAAPVPVAVVNEEAAAYSTAPVQVVDVNDLTAEARVATAFAIFGMVLTRMIRTVVRMTWTVVKVAVRIITFPVRKLFTITRRTKTVA